MWVVLVHALLSLGRVTEMPTRSVRQLDQLLAGTPEVVVREVIGKANVQVSEITHDSSKVVKGSIFCCVVGENTDGHNFAQDAKTTGQLR